MRLLLNMILWSKSRVLDSIHWNLTTFVFILHHTYQNYNRLRVIRYIWSGEHITVFTNNISESKDIIQGHLCYESQFGSGVLSWMLEDRCRKQDFLIGRKVKITKLFKWVVKNDFFSKIECSGALGRVECPRDSATPFRRNSLPDS